MANLYVMCGAPGSGKSTFAKSLAKNRHALHVSRDIIRFSLLKNGESYFSHESEVTDIFWNTINKALAAGQNVIADQTSLNYRSRLYLLDHISVPCKKYAIYMDVPYRVCRERNARRVGITCVPEDKLRGMFNSFTIPSLKEGFDVIASVGEDNKLIIEEGDD